MESLAVSAGEVAATGSGAGGAREVRVATLLALVAAHRGTPRQRVVQRALETELRRGLGSKDESGSASGGDIRPEWAVAACLGWDNPRAASIVFADRRAWLSAVRCRIRSIEPATGSLAAAAAAAAAANGAPERINSNSNSNGEATVTVADPLLRRRVEAELTTLMVDLAVKAEGVRERAAALGAVTEVWQRCRLSQDRLEALLVDRVASVTSSSSSVGTGTREGSSLGVGDAREGFGGGGGGGGGMSNGRASDDDGSGRGVTVDALMLLLSRNRAMTASAAATRAAAMIPQSDSPSLGEEDDNPGSAWDAAVAAAARIGSGTGGVMGSSSSSIPLASKLRFSATFALSVASLRVASLDESHAAAHSASVRLMWSQVKGNLNKRLASSTAIRHAMPVVESYREDGNSWVFSCGHRYEGARMKEETLPALAAQMKGAGVPLAGELLVADYRLRRCAVACPACSTRAVYQTYAVGGETTAGVAAAAAAATAE